MLEILKKNSEFPEGNLPGIPATFFFQKLHEKFFEEAFNTFNASSRNSPYNEIPRICPEMLPPGYIRGTPPGNFPKTPSIRHFKIPLRDYSLSAHSISVVLMVVANRACSGRFIQKFLQTFFQHFFLELFHFLSVWDSYSLIFL